MRSGSEGTQGLCSFLGEGVSSVLGFDVRCSPYDRSTVYKDTGLLEVDLEVQMLG